MPNLDIPLICDDGTINIALDTINKGKQALVFVNSKRSAEKVAEEISKKLKAESQKKLSEDVLKALQKPTRQCERLAKCIVKGIAFHHAGLHSKQKSLVEDSFKEGKIKIICCTPTLAAGLDLPAFRAIIRDVKRYADRIGMSYIPVLEYLQMAGRAGRPKYDTYGEAIIVSNAEGEKNAVTDKYVFGEAESIYSKLAVEPALRKHVLSLISAQVVRSYAEINKFFSKTFWAHQYKDMGKLEDIMEKVLLLLQKWDFVQLVDEKYRATILGKRVAELYIDPLTAHNFLTGLKRANKPNSFSFIHLVSNSPEMYPLLKIKQKEFDDFQNKMMIHDANLLVLEPSMFDIDYEDYMNSSKTALMLYDWAEEKDDEYLYENYGIRPGETRVKLETADWLLFAIHELAHIENHNELLKDIAKTRFRLKNGVKEELIPLLKFKKVGRVRARALFSSGVKDLAGVKKASISELTSILGKKIAESVKNQIEGKKVNEQLTQE